MYLMIQLKKAGPKPDEIYPFTCKFVYPGAKPILKWKIVNRMMSLHPEERPSFDEIRKELGEFKLPQEERLPLVVPTLKAEWYAKDYVIINKIA